MQVIGIIDQMSIRESPKPDATIWGNNIYFRGLEDEQKSTQKGVGMEAAPSDIIFVNEALETLESKVNGWVMRCRKLVVMDWNPKYTVHWCFNLEGRFNTFFTHSTYKDNKHLEKSIIQGIEGYEPWITGSYEVHDNQCWYRGKPIDEKNQPPPHPDNVRIDTADEFRWKVYGLGLRSAMSGLIFKNIIYIDEFPGIGFHYGMDFGFTSDPTAIVKHAETRRDIYVELLCYTPTQTPEEIDQYATVRGINKLLPTTADSADKYTGENKGTVEMVKSLRQKGWNISKVNKTKSVIFWINNMKEKRINIVRNDLSKYAKKEAENYTMKKINGIEINQPIDGFDHFWSAARYAHMAWNNPKQKAFW